MSDGTQCSQCSSTNNEPTGVYGIDGAGKQYETRVCYECGNRFEVEYFGLLELVEVASRTGAEK